MARTKQSRPDYGLGFRAKVIKSFYVLPSSLGSGYGALSRPKKTKPKALNPTPKALNFRRGSLLARKWRVSCEYLVGASEAESHLPIVCTPKSANDGFGV